MSSLSCLPPVSESPSMQGGNLILTKIHVLNVNCESLKAKDCQIETILAETGAVLYNCFVKNCRVIEGGLIYSCEGESVDEEDTQRTQLLLARDSMTLNFIAVNQVIVTDGALRAKNCGIDTVETRQTIELVQSAASRVILNVDPRNLAVLRLKESNIRGNVHIRIIPQKESHVVFEKERTIKGKNMVSSTVGDTHVLIVDSTFTITGPISDNLLDILKDLPFGTNGVVNGEPCIYEGGVTFAYTKNSLKSKQPDEVILYIYGGIIQGKVIFEDCKGSIVTHRKAEIIGGVSSTMGSYFGP